MEVAKRILSAIFLVITLFRSGHAWAAMSSTNYNIQWDSVGIGGSDTASSSSYTVRGGFETTGSISNSTNYRIAAGYNVSVHDPVVRFEVFGQNRTTQVAATAMTSTTVTVTSASGYAADDYIAVVQDEGASQVAAIGKITGVAGSVLTVDAFAYASSLPTIDGSNDYVYELSGATASLGTASTSVVTTGIIGWHATADVAQGYSVYVYEDHGLRHDTDTSEIVYDVSDGTVSAGAEEYGARSSDTSLANSTFDTMDSPISNALEQVASRTTYSFSQRDFLTLKLATDGTGTAGSYSHTITLVLVGDY